MDIKKIEQKVEHVAVETAEVAAGVVVAPVAAVGLGVVEVVTGGRFDIESGQILHKEKQPEKES
jgi:hypothetical protein